MIGCASTPADRQARDNRWNVPKCKIRMIPNIPTHPASKPFSSGKKRTPPHNNNPPNTVLILAQIHSLIFGWWASLCASRKASASIPGHAKRYPSDLVIPTLAALPLCSHQVCHLQPTKIAAASTHMKSHGTRRDPSAMATTGRISMGIQPGQIGRLETRAVPHPTAAWFAVSARFTRTMSLPL